MCLDVTASEADTLILDFKKLYCLNTNFALRQPRLHVLLVNYQLLNSNFLIGDDET